jgi:hypothetical protein
MAMWNREANPAFIAAEGQLAKEALMKTIMKAAAGAFLAGGVIAATAAPADAAVRIGVALPGPAFYPAPYYAPPPCYAYGPYSCPPPVYYGPAYYRYWGPAWYGWHPARHFRRW